MFTLWLALVGLAGCSPALDWRDSRVPEARLQFLLPCRPDRHERELALAGEALRLQMQFCEADGQTFAVAAANVDQPARVGPVLQALHVAFAHNLGLAGPVAGGEAWQPPGASPQAEAGRWLLVGRTPAGEPVHAELVLATQGTWVVQATVLARRPLSAEAAQTFREGLRFGP